MARKSKKTFPSNVVPFPGNPKEKRNYSPAEILEQIKHQLLQDLHAEKETVRVNAARVLAQIALADRTHQREKEEEVVIKYSDISVKPDKEPVPQAGA